MDPGEAAAIAAVAHRLRKRFPQLTAAEIDEATERAERAYDGCPVRTFIPILVERDVIESLSSSSSPSIPTQRRPAESFPNVPA